MWRKMYLFNVDFIYWNPGQNSDLDMQCRKKYVKILSKPEYEGRKWVKTKNLDYEP